MQKIIDLVKESTGTTSTGIAMAMIIVGALIVVFALISVGISIVLFFKYRKLNKTPNSCGMSGEEVARRILDDNGLQQIKIKCTGSLLWGNSYSHYFKKLRLRRFTYKKRSVTSLAMASQKSALAIMDKEGDPIMKKRNVLIPLQFFGPMMFIPLIAIGVCIDLVLATKGHNNFVCTFISAGLGLAIYVVALLLTIVILKAETKAQAKSIEILRQNNLATEDEIESIKDLYKCYNIEYVNNIIISALELLLRVLQIIGAIQGRASSSNNNN